MNRTIDDKNLYGKIELAGQYYEEDKPRQSLRLLKDIIKSQEALENEDILLKALSYSARLLLERQKFTAALRILERARKIENWSEDKINVVIDLIICLGQLQRSEYAVTVFLEAEYILSRSPDVKRSKQSSILHLGCSLYASLIKKGKDYHKQFEDTFKKLEENFSDTLDYLDAAFSKAQLIQENLVGSLKLLRQIVEYPETDNDGSEIYKAKAYHWLAHLYEQNDFDLNDALEYLRRAKKYDPDLEKDLNRLLLSALLNFKLRNYEESIKSCLAYKKLYRVWKMPLLSYLYCLRVLAESYRRIGQKNKYWKVLRKIFAKRPFSLLSLPYIPDSLWLEKGSFKRILMEHI